MSVFKKIKKNIWRGIKAYACLYILGTVAALGDYCISNKPRIDRGETVQILKVHKYKVKIDGKEKILTLAGECHFYNKAEYDIAKKLVDENKHFANECGANPINEMSLGNFLYLCAYSLPSSISHLYWTSGNGRKYDSIDEIASDKGHKVHALENPNDPFSNMSFGEKVGFLGDAVLSALLAPIVYFEAKNEKPFDPEKYKNFKYRESLIDKRDKVMADTLVELLKKEEIDKLLAEVGRAHLEGVIKNLSEQVELEEIKE